MRQSFVVYGMLGFNHICDQIRGIVGDAFAAGHSVELILKTSDTPTDLMRKKWHAMMGDVAKQVPEHKGVKMNLERWKAVVMGAAIEQEWLPAFGGSGVVPFRKSSEDLSKKQYCDCIEVTYMIGSHFGVVWKDPKISQEKNNEH